MNRYFSQVMTIIWKDFITEIKTRELFSSMFIFALLVVIIFIFSINLSLIQASEVGPGVLWVAFLFAGTIGLNRSFMLEKENGCLQVLRGSHKCGRIGVASSAHGQDGTLFWKTGQQLRVFVNYGGLYPTTFHGFF